MLEDAIFTAPAHPSWGGAGLIGGDGKLLGIGSLVMQQQDGKGRRVDLNMVVPASLLPPILDDLLYYGRPNQPGAALARPLCRPRTRTASSSVPWPATGRRRRPGCRKATGSLAVGGTRVADLPGLWRAVWACGTAGAKVRVTVSREADAAGADPGLDRPAQLPQGAKAALTEDLETLALRRQARRLLAPWDGPAHPAPRSAWCGMARWCCMKAPARPASNSACRSGRRRASASPRSASSSPAPRSCCWRRKAGSRSSDDIRE